MKPDEFALELHKKYRGKITTALRDDGELTREKLAAYYSPGVGEISLAIVDDPRKLRTYTWTNNLVAVISDGSAVLGLGNVGAKAALPVMEGKAMLFKYFAGIDSIPIVLNVHTPDEIVATVRAMARSFGAINLEDIAAPKCFEVEERLKAELDIPVMHDDQHGTAIVVLAGLINAMKVVGKNLGDCTIALAGAGAAGVAIAKLLHKYARPKILAVDTRGIISRTRTDLNDSKLMLLDYTNRRHREGTLADAMVGADIFIGVSRGGLVTAKMVSSMAENPIVFALANPTPEIMPTKAHGAGAAVVATGRSDFPNQVNNALAFPGIFRGALDHRVHSISDRHKIAAAEALASLVENPTPDCIIPSVFDPRVVPTIAAVIR